MLASLHPAEFFYLLPICLAISLVTSASRRDRIDEILRHALRSWIVLVGGILVFMVGVSYLFEWVLPR